jgi:UDP-N-acetylmuramoyl-tripeptide--D-alanyl-D-alanine ligase
MMTLGQVHSWLPGSSLVGDPSVTVSRVHTDTRSLLPGDLFVALRGERFDGNDMLASAQSAGAVAAVAERGLAAAGLAGVEVANSRAALGQLARAWRARFSLPLVAVTGSNGKTTVTQMIASIFKAWKAGTAFATQGNLNNDIGVPMTLLRLRASHQVGVVELGMNHPGEIAALADMARPTIAIVNNAQREHQEFMVSVDAVAQENGEVIRALPVGGTAVFPAGDDYSGLWKQLADGRKVLTFGMDDASQADVLGWAEWRSGAWQVTARTQLGELRYALRIAGRHNVLNSLAAVAGAMAADAPAWAIQAGLGQFVPVKGRSRAFELRAGGRSMTVVDDTYNANPDSVRAAIDVLAELPEPRLLVLGDMGEVGNQGPEFHAEAGAYALERGITNLLTLGDLAKGMHGRHFQDMPSLCAAVVAALPGTRSLLVKGSRFMKMERVIEAVEATCPQSVEATSHAA